MGTTTEPGQLDLREQLVRIDRAIAETRKFQEESNKLQTEAAKLRVDRWIAPILVLASVLGGTIVAAVNHFWK